MVSVIDEVLSCIDFAVMEQDQYFNEAEEPSSSTATVSAVLSHRKCTDEKNLKLECAESSIRSNSIMETDKAEISVDHDKLNMDVVVLGTSINLCFDATYEDEIGNTEDVNINRSECVLEAQEVPLATTEVTKPQPYNSNDRLAIENHMSGVVLESKCPSCGSTSEPQFVHYKKISQPPFRKNEKNLFIWRYRCSIKACFQFFGDFYRFDKDTNTFLTVGADGKPLSEEIGKVRAETISNDIILFDASATKNIDTNIDTNIDMESSTFITKENETTTDNTKDYESSDNNFENVSMQTSKPSNLHSGKGRRARNTVRKSTGYRYKGFQHQSPSKITDSVIETSKKLPRVSSKIEMEDKIVTPKRLNELEETDIPSKKLRKGYAYVLEPSESSIIGSISSFSSMLSSRRTDVVSCEEWTQTQDDEHIKASLMDQIIKNQTTTMGFDQSIKLPSHISRRLLLSQKLIRSQSEQMELLRSENAMLMRTVNTMSTVMKTFKDGYGSEMRRLRDDVEYLKKELQFYQEELIADARKSIENMRVEKSETQKSVDGLLRNNRKFEALLELRNKEVRSWDERADGYLRDICVRDRAVILANKDRDDAEKKLSDSLFMANNAKCAHCQISDKMRRHMTDEVAEKTMLLEKTQKERNELQRRAEHSERIAQILSKENQKLQFELRTWKVEAERTSAELSKIKSTLDESAFSSGSIMQTPYCESTTPQVETLLGETVVNEMCSSIDSYGDDMDKNKKKGLDKCAQSESLPEEFECSRSSSCDTNSLSPTSLSNLPPPPAPPCPFSNWIPKDKKVSTPPPGFFFQSTLTSNRPGHAGTAHKHSTHIKHVDATSKSVSKTVVTDKTAIPVESKPSDTTSKKSLKAIKRKVKKTTVTELMAQKKQMSSTISKRIGTETTITASFQKTSVKRVRSTDLPIGGYDGMKQRDTKKDLVSTNPTMLLLGKSNIRIPKKTPVQNDRISESPCSSQSDETPSKPSIPGLNDPAYSATNEVRSNEKKASITKNNAATQRLSGSKIEERTKVGATKEWKDELNKQSSKGRPKSAVDAFEFSLPFNGPRSINIPGSSGIQRAPSPLLSGLSGSRRNNPWSEISPDHPLPFEPIDESWGQRRTMSPLNTSASSDFGCGLPWHRRDSEPYNAWKRRNEHWGQPTFPIRKGVSWISNDSWAGNETVRNGSQRSAQQRRNFWDP